MTAFHTEAFEDTPSSGVRGDGFVSAIARALEQAVDPDFYAFAYGELGPGESAATHYRTTGWREGRDPNPWFATSAYLAANPDVEDIVPLFHYLEYGHAEGRRAVPSERAAAYYARAGNGAVAGVPGDVSAAEPPSFDRERLWEDIRNGAGVLHSFPPSFFDEAFYRRAIAKNGLAEPRSGESLLEHWVREGRPRHVVPTPRFDEDFYKQRHPDLPAEEFGFMHYLEHGAHEGRQPNIWFDPGFYRAESTGDDSSLPGYVHFLAHGMAQGRFPGPALAELAARQGGAAALTPAVFDDLVQASQGWSAGLDAYALRLLLALYVPEWHGIDAAKDVFAHLVTYLRDEMPRGALPGPLFDADLYARRAAEASLPPIRNGESAVTHWLVHGVPDRIVPTLRFDEAFYRKTNHDIARTPLWGFSHFILSGIREGRRPKSEAGARHFVRAATLSKDAGSLPSWYREWFALDFPGRALPASGELDEAAVARAEIRLQQQTATPTFREIMRRAQALEPAVGELGQIHEDLLLPFHEPVALVHAEVRRRLPRESYDTIVCVPWIRMGGSDLMACQIAKAIRRVRPDERVLLLRCDAPNLERPDWLPRDVDVVDISDVRERLGQAGAEYLLQALFLGAAPKRVVNVNSALGWLTLRRFGARLALSTNLYAYLFCWDHLPSGLRVGYPAEFFAEASTFMTAIMTDTAYLKGELSRMYLLPPEVDAKIVPLFSPPLPADRSLLAATRAANANCTRDPRLVLWAGRLDRQKRFDLFVEIAKRMPGVEFHCWGQPVMDDPPDLALLPANLVMHEPFVNFEELPLARAGAWLFTSAWEGMPNTIINLANYGMPVVASDVGGVGELIRPDTGWPIPPELGAQPYVDALHRALSQPKEAATRAERLRELVSSRYVEERYDQSVAALLDAEGT